MTSLTLRENPAWLSESGAIYLNYPPGARPPTAGLLQNLHHHGPEQAVLGELDCSGVYICPVTDIDPAPGGYSQYCRETFDGSAYDRGDETSGHNCSQYSWLCELDDVCGTRIREWNHQMMMGNCIGTWDIMAPPVVGTFCNTPCIVIGVGSQCYKGTVKVWMNVGCMSPPDAPDDPDPCTGTHYQCVASTSFMSRVNQ